MIIFLFFGIYFIGVFVGSINQDIICNLEKKEIQAEKLRNELGTLIGIAGKIIIEEVKNNNSLIFQGPVNENYSIKEFRINGENMSK